MRISRNFTLEELTKSTTAARHGIKNMPDAKQLESLKLLTEKVLQPLREKLGLPIRINSGFRSNKLNKLVGGSTKSQHSKGEAADMEVIGVDNKKLAEWIRENIEFDQLILEFYDAAANDPNSGWVHVSYSDKKLREQVLTAKRIRGKTVYLKGLVT